jgi:hypothetical protein
MSPLLAAPAVKKRNRFFYELAKRDVGFPPRNAQGAATGGRPLSSTAGVIAELSLQERI